MKNIVLSACFVFIAMTAKSQGCSDAGFCSIGAMKSQSNAGEKASSIGLSVTLGAGERSTTILIPQIEGRLFVGSKSYFELKIPVNRGSGDLGDHTGLGDPIINYTRTIASKKNITIDATAGLRISTGNASATDKFGNPLPMPYQSNLGTTDLILGASASLGKYLSLAAGYQQPLFQYNENGYLPTMIDMPANEYFASRKLERRGDVLLRAEGRYQWKHLGVAAGPLFIFHLGEDKITLDDGSQIALQGSDGLTVNIAGSIFYTMKRLRFDLAAGTPMVVRDYRPDGLTRSFVITPRVTYLFEKKKN